MADCCSQQFFWGRVIQVDHMVQVILRVQVVQVVRVVRVAQAGRMYERCDNNR